MVKKEKLLWDVNNLSPYTNFMLDNIGYYFENKKNGKKLDKWEIWETFGDDFHTLNLIYLNRHSLYKRVKKEVENE